MKLDSVGEAFIKKQEQLRLVSYKDVAGVWTIGWGFTRNPHTGKPITEYLVITPDEAELWWGLTVAPFEATVTQALRVIIQDNKLTQNMFNACGSLCYNIGQEAFAKSTLVKYINNTINVNNITIQNSMTLLTVQQFVKSAIAYWFLVWHTSAGSIVPDLVQRRKDEIKLYYS